MMKPSVSVQVTEVLPLFNFLFYFFDRPEAGPTKPASLFFYITVIFFTLAVRYTHVNDNIEARECGSIAGVVPTAGNEDFGQSPMSRIREASCGQRLVRAG